MAMPLLATKLYIPPVRSELAPRPRLIERLDAGLHRKLTLISAPAGSGKTTLVTEWLNTTGRPFSSLSLDEKEENAYASQWDLWMPHFLAICRVGGGGIQRHSRPPHSLQWPAVVGRGLEPTSFLRLRHTGRSGGRGALPLGRYRCGSDHRVTAVGWLYSYESDVGDICMRCF